MVDIQRIGTVFRVHRIELGNGTILANSLDPIIPSILVPFPQPIRRQSLEEVPQNRNVPNLLLKELMDDQRMLPRREYRWRGNK